MSTTHQESDFGTPETNSQGGGITKGYSTESGKVAKLNHQNHFDWMLHRGVVSEKQWEAGERLRRDAYISGQFAYIKSSADFSVKGNISSEPAEFVADAEVRYRAALKTLAIEELKMVNIYVIDDGYIMEKNRRKQIANLTSLRHGLDTLIKYYKL